MGAYLREWATQHEMTFRPFGQHDAWEISLGDGPAGIGFVVGGMASLALGRVLRNQVYGVATTDPVTLIGISVVLTVAVVAACVAPALRAVRTDPALVLRE